MIHQFHHLSFMCFIYPNQLNLDSAEHLAILRIQFTGGCCLTRTVHVGGSLSHPCRGTGPSLIPAAWPITSPGYISVRPITRLGGTIRNNLSDRAFNMTNYVLQIKWPDYPKLKLWPIKKKLPHTTRQSHLLRIWKWWKIAVLHIHIYRYISKLSQCKKKKVIANKSSTEFFLF